MRIVGLALLQQGRLPAAGNQRKPGCRKLFRFAGLGKNKKMAQAALFAVQHQAAQNSRGNSAALRLRRYAKTAQHRARQKPAGDHDPVFVISKAIVAPGGHAQPGGGQQPFGLGPFRVDQYFAVLLHALSPWACARSVRLFKTGSPRKAQAPFGEA